MITPPDRTAQTPTQAANGLAIVADSLWRIYRTGSQEVPALRGLHLEIPAGRFVALKGRSGSGKTTLLNCLAGLDQPTSGTITIFGQELSRLDDAHLTAWRRENVGLVFQSFSLLASLSAYENVELLLRILGLPWTERRARALECLSQVGLQEYAHHRPYELSGGQQQRVAIARSLANHPRLILADEPTGELDSVTSREILALFRQIVEGEGITLLMVSHDALVDEYAHQVLHLKDGQLQNANGTAPDGK